MTSYDVYGDVFTIVHKDVKGRSVRMMTVHACTGEAKFRNKTFLVGLTCSWYSFRKEYMASGTKRVCRQRVKWLIDILGWDLIAFEWAALNPDRYTTGSSRYEATRADEGVGWVPVDETAVCRWLGSSAEPPLAGYYTFTAESTGTTETRSDCITRKKKQNNIYKNIQNRSWWLDFNFLLTTQGHPMTIIIIIILIIIVIIILMDISMAHDP